jgi:endonuclease/exonuclease/phosphatase family metal-dependent hydrolase
MAGLMPRIMTYNVHRCVGADGRLDVARTAKVIAQAKPDVVALQELDVGRARTGGVDQAHAIAELLGMKFHFHPALKLEEERYGDAILSTRPLRLVRAGPLPNSDSMRGLEPRGALWVKVDFGTVEVDVVNTHLGLVPHEQRAQADALMSGDWMAHEDCTDPAILLGDFNATSRHAAYRKIATRLTDAKRVVRRGPLATFPARLPMIRIDHVFVSRSVQVTGVHAPRNRLTREASDHLPLIVDFRVESRR